MMSSLEMKCEICNRRFVLKELIHHYFGHMKNKNYPCKFCDLVFKKILDLNLHLQSFHKISRSFNCPKCHKKLLCFYEFLFHMRDAHLIKNNVPSDESVKKIKSGQVVEQKECKVVQNSISNVESYEISKDVNNLNLPHKSSCLQIIPISQNNSNTSPTTSCLPGVCKNAFSLKITPICNEQKSISSSSKKTVNKVLISVVPNKPNEVLCPASKNVNVKIVDNSVLNKQISSNCQIFTKSTFDASKHRNPLSSVDISGSEKLKNVYFSKELSVHKTMLMNGPSKDVGKQSSRNIKSSSKLCNIFDEKFQSHNNLDVNLSISNKTNNITYLNQETTQGVSVHTTSSFSSFSKEKPVEKSLIKSSQRLNFSFSEDEMKRTSCINKNATLKNIPTCEINKVTLYRTEQLIEKNQTNAQFIQSSFNEKLSIESDNSFKTENKNYFSKNKQVREEVFTYEIIGKVSLKNKQLSKDLPNTSQITSEKRKPQNVKRKGFQDAIFFNKGKAKDLKLIKKYLLKRKRQLIKECKELMKNLNPEDFPVLESVSATVTQSDINKFLPTVLLTKINLNKTANAKNVNDNFHSKVNSRCAISTFQTKFENKTSKKIFDRNYEVLSMKRVNKKVKEIDVHGSKPKDLEALVPISGSQKGNSNECDSSLKAIELKKSYEKKNNNITCIQISDHSKISNSLLNRGNLNKFDHIPNQNSSIFKTHRNNSSDIKLRFLEAESISKTSLGQSSKTSTISTRKNEDEKSTIISAPVSTKYINKLSTKKIAPKQSLKTRETSHKDPDTSSLRRFKAKESTLTEVKEGLDNESILNSSRVADCSLKSHTELQSKFQQILAKCDTEISSFNHIDVRSNKRSSQELDFPRPKKQRTEIKAKSGDNIQESRSLKESVRTSSDLYVDPMLVNAKRAWQIHLEAEKNLISKLKSSTQNFSLPSIDLRIDPDDTFTIHCPCGAYECNRQNHNSNTDCEYVLY